jgi:PAS domain S-box-containing protein
MLDGDNQMKTTIDCKALVEAIGDAVVGADAKGAITLWNPYAERMFGWTEAEALGQTLDLITPERLRARHWEGYHHSMQTGTTKYGAGEMLRVPAAHKDGRPLSIAFTVTMLKAPDGQVESVIAVIRDESVRFAEDRALKKKLAELEAKIAANG